MSETLLGVRVPDWMKRLVDNDKRTNQEIVRTALRREFGTDEASRLETRLEHRREQRRMYEREKQEIVNKIHSLEEEISTLESQIESIEETSASYEADLDGILEQMEEKGMYVDPGHGMVTAVAARHDENPQGVIEALKSRAAERDLEIPLRQFDDGETGGGLH